MKNPFKLALIATVIVVGALAGTLILKDRSTSHSQTPEQTHTPEHVGPIAWQTYDEGLANAAADNKLVMIEFFATWCGYCKKMDKQVFPDPTVQAQLSKYFVPVRVTESSSNEVTFQGKTMSEKELTQQFGVTGFPTIVFLDSAGEPITKIPGFVPAETLEGALAFVGSGAYKNMEYKDFQKQRS